MARTVERDVINIRDRGVGDGVADDTEAVQTAFDDAAATGKMVYFPHGTYRCGSLNALRVKNIRMDGVISSIATDDYGILIGTETNANNDGLFGTLEVRITRSSNADMEGVDGIRVRGLAHVNARLMADRFDVGVAIRPGTAGTQYVAYNNFEQIRVYGCRTGLLLDLDLSGSGNTPFINENTWQNVSVTSGDNSLSGDEAGIVLTSGNNNHFIRPALEGLTIPLWIKAGIRNRFEMCRLESSGNVLFGTGSTSYIAGENIVTAAYAQTDLLTPAGTQQSPALNFCLPESGAAWREVYGGASATVVVPVSTGDILDIDVGVQGSPTNYFTAQALDSSQAALPTLSTGAMPYIGSLWSSLANGTSGTAATMTVSAAHYPLGKRFVGPTRSEVKYLSIAPIGGVTYDWMVIRKLVGNMGQWSNPLKVEA